jgi:hypothetical protein
VRLMRTLSLRVLHRRSHGITNHAASSPARSNGRLSLSIQSTRPHRPVGHYPGQRNQARNQIRPNYTCSIVGALGQIPPAT